MIHYHGTPLTPVADMVKAFAGRHAMVSFAHHEQIEIAAEICQSVVLDNGAFSAWKAGKRLDIGGYSEWCEEWIRHPAVEWCVIPDQIDGDGGVNDLLADNWHLPPAVSVPVYHLHESPERLIRLAKKWPRIALGSSGRYSDPGSDRWWDRIAEVLPAIMDKDGFPITKIHGLRMLNPGIFSKLPLASADSCMVARNVGLDTAWKGTFMPRSQSVRALILMDRIEAHASAATWEGASVGAYHNMSLLG